MRISDWSSDVCSSDLDYTDIIDNPEDRVPVINYLLHRLEELIDGRPLIYVMDEFWKILDGSGGLKEFAKNKQKTIRKQNGLGIFATQSPEDALQSDISAALIEQTATLVLLPNPNASREDYVEGLKLTDAEYQVVKSLDERSRCFLVKQGHASSVCQLNLRGMDDAMSVISASTVNMSIMQGVLGPTGAERHLRRADRADRNARAAAEPQRQPRGLRRRFEAHRCRVSGGQEPGRALALLPGQAGACVKRLPAQPPRDGRCAVGHFGLDRQHRGHAWRAGREGDGAMHERRRPGAGAVAGDVLCDAEGVR